MPPGWRRSAPCSPSARPADPWRRTNDGPDRACATSASPLPCRQKSGDLSHPSDLEAAGHALPGDLGRGPPVGLPADRRPHRRLRGRLRGPRPRARRHGAGIPRRALRRGRAPRTDRRARPALSRARDRGGARRRLAAAPDPVRQRRAQRAQLARRSAALRRSDQGRQGQSSPSGLWRRAPPRSCTRSTGCGRTAAASPSTTSASTGARWPCFPSSRPTWSSSI